MQSPSKPLLTKIMPLIGCPHYDESQLACLFETLMQSETCDQIFAVRAQ
jgi:hypothetical protein